MSIQNVPIVLIKRLKIDLIKSLYEKKFKEQKEITQEMKDLKEELISLLLNAFEKLKVRNKADRDDEKLI